MLLLHQSLYIIVTKDKIYNVFHWGHHDINQGVKIIEGNQHIIRCSSIIIDS